MVWIQIKRVGPGNSINIWNDNWIPGALKLKPLLRQEHVIVEQVDELFIQGTRRWNEDLVRDSFVPWDAEEILKIKAGVRMVEDTVVCRGGSSVGARGAPAPPTSLRTMENYRR